MGKKSRLKKEKKRALMMSSSSSSTPLIQPSSQAEAAQEATTSFAAQVVPVTPSSSAQVVPATSTSLFDSRRSAANQISGFVDFIDLFSQVASLLSSSSSKKIRETKLNQFLIQVYVDYFGQPPRGKMNRVSALNVGNMILQLLDGVDTRLKLKIKLFERHMTNILQQYRAIFLMLDIVHLCKDLKKELRMEKMSPAYILKSKGIVLKRNIRCRALMVLHRKGKIKERRPGAVLPAQPAAINQDDSERMEYIRALVEKVDCLIRELLTLPIVVVGSHFQFNIVRVMSRLYNFRGPIRFNPSLDVAKIEELTLAAKGLRIELAPERDAAGASTSSGF